MVPQVKSALPSVCAPCSRGGTSPGAGAKKRPATKRPSGADGGAGPAIKRQRAGSAGGVEEQTARRQLDLALDALAIEREKIKQAEEKVKEAEEKVKEAEGKAARIKWLRGAGIAPAAAGAAPGEQLDTEEGQRRLVDALSAKWGLREKRFEVPMRLTTDEFSFSQTQEREAALSDLFGTWRTNYEAGTNGREKLPLPAVPAAPGTGKSRLAWLGAARGQLPGQAEVDAEWQKAMDKLEADDFKKGIQNAVGVAVTFNCDADPVEGEEHRFMIGVRMLYGHFCDVTVVTFVRFLELLRYRGCHQIDTTTALRIIERDIQANHALNGGAQRHVILVVDEPLKPVNGDTPKDRKEQLGALTTSVGQLITNSPHVHVLMTSLSGNDLKEACRTASGRLVHFLEGFTMLSKEAVERLVNAEEGPKHARLQDGRFRAVLSECLGVPRLLEKVFKAALSVDINEDSACDTIRVVVRKLFGSGGKYGDRALRSHALLAAFSDWRPATDARREKTRAAEREGYLFDGRIPPLLLKWWWAMEDERTQADETHALLQAAVGIYTLSDEIGGAEFGRRFERQLAHLWRILTITDSVSRREVGEHRPRTIHGVLGKNQTAVAAGAVFSAHLGDKRAVFNKSLEEADLTLIQAPFAKMGPPGAPMQLSQDMTSGSVYLPTNEQNPGFDWALHEGAVLMLVETKFSEAEVTTALSQNEIVDKFVLAVKEFPYVKTCLLKNRLCYTIGGLRNVHAGVMKNREDLIDAIVEGLRSGNVVTHKSLKKFVGQSLVLLTRDHTEALLTPTLASLPPFGKRW